MVTEPTNTEARKQHGQWHTDKCDILEGNPYAHRKPQVTAAQVYQNHLKQSVDIVIKMIWLTKYIWYPKSSWHIYFSYRFLK